MSNSTEEIKLSTPEIEDALYLRKPESHEITADTLSFENTKISDPEFAYPLQDDSLNRTTATAVLYHGRTLEELFDGLSLTFPTQSSHSTKSQIVWQGEVIPDDRAKTILLEELKPKSEGSTLLLSEQYFLKGRKYMILVMGVVDRDWALDLEQSSGEYVLSTVPTSEGMLASERTNMVNHLRTACSESRDESIRHFKVLSDSVLELLLEYVLRHLKPVLTYKYDENALQKEKKDDETDEEDDEED